MIFAIWKQKYRAWLIGLTHYSQPTKRFSNLKIPVVKYLLLWQFKKVLLIVCLLTWCCIDAFSSNSENWRTKLGKHRSLGLDRFTRKKRGITGFFWTKLMAKKIKTQTKNSRKFFVKFKTPANFINNLIQNSTNLLTYLG